MFFDLGFVKPADESRNDVTVFRVIIVAGTIKIGRHQAAKIRAMALAVLPVVAFTQLDSGDLGDGVGFVCGFDSARQ